MPYLESVYQVLNDLATEKELVAEAVNIFFVAMFAVEVTRFEVRERVLLDGKYRKYKRTDGEGLGNVVFSVVF